MSAVTKATRDLVLGRDHWMCAWCGCSIDVSRGDYSLQHRRARGMGGSRRPETNLAGNLVTMCGSATTGCHGYAESHREESTERGFTIPQHVADPASVPLRHVLYGRVTLDNEGQIYPVEVI